MHTHTHTKANTDTSFCFSKTKKQVQLLKKAIECIDHDSRLHSTTQMNRNAAKGGKTVKISWKLVAEFIACNGGSYHFGNATCRKKWDEIQRNMG